MYLYMRVLPWSSRSAVLISLEEWISKQYSTFPYSLDPQKYQLRWCAIQFHFRAFSAIRVDSSGIDNHSRSVSLPRFGRWNEAQMGGKRLACGKRGRRSLCVKEANVRCNGRCTKIELFQIWREHIETGKRTQVQSRAAIGEVSDFG